MRRSARLPGVVLAVLAVPFLAHAQPAPSTAAPVPPSPSQSAAAAPSAPAASSSAVPAPAAIPAPAPAPIADSVDLSRGVAVTAADDTSAPLARQLAQRVYADPLLRPRRLDDPTARALIGDPLAADATARQHELAALRSSFSPRHDSSPSMLAALSTELDVSGVVVVWAEAPEQVRAALFVAARKAFSPRDLSPARDSSGALSWTGSVA